MSQQASRYCSSYIIPVLCFCIIRNISGGVDIVLRYCSCHIPLTLRNFLCCDEPLKLGFGFWALGRRAAFSLALLFHTHTPPKSGNGPWREKKSAKDRGKMLSFWVDFVKDFVFWYWIVCLLSWADGVRNSDGFFWVSPSPTPGFSSLAACSLLSWAEAKKNFGAFFFNLETLATGRSTPKLK